MIDYLPALLVLSIGVTCVMLGFEFCLIGLSILADWVRGPGPGVSVRRTAIGARTPRG